jgi:hypothetical protein
MKMMIIGHLAALEAHDSGSGLPLMDSNHDLRIQSAVSCH